MQHLRDEHDEKSVEQLHFSHADHKSAPKTLVTPNVEELLKSKKRRPLVAIAMLSWYLEQEYKTKTITYMEYLSMNANLSGLINGFNGVDKVSRCGISPRPEPHASPA